VRACASRCPFTALAALNFFDLLLRNHSTNGVFYYFSDHLKTASVVTDSLGNIKSESDFYPWGSELQFVNNDSNHYKFTGKERDTETGLDYFGARYYSNGLGRWVSADWSAAPVPVPYSDGADPQTLNLYGYVRNLPTTKADSDGHGDAMTHFWQCKGSTAPGCAAANHNTTPGEAVVEGATMGLWFGGGLLAPAAGPIARGLIGLFFVTAPVTMPIVVDVLEGATPGPPGTLTIASATRLTAQEISAGTRYASKTGTALIESTHVAEEFVDAAKKTYDVMQPGASKFWTAANAQNFGKKLVDHLLHDDKVIIDLKDASKAQVKDIKDFVKTLTKEEQKRVDYVR
jgi:RHS repeat-associated protein